MRKFLIFVLLIYFPCCFCDLALAPISYKGRIRPVGVYAESIFYDFYQAFHPEAQDSSAFKLNDSLSIITNLYLDGYEKWQEAPFFWIDAKAKRLLRLDSSKRRFSYTDIKDAFYSNVEALKVIANYYFLKDSLKTLDKQLIVEDYKVVAGASKAPWNLLKVGEIVHTSTYNTHLAESLINTLQKLATFETFKGILYKENQQEVSFKDQLKEDLHFHLLPGRYQKGEWLGLKALSSTERNFTLYKDVTFQSIRNAFLQWVDNRSNNLAKENFAKILLESYAEIAGQPLLKSANNQSFYPSILQLKLELGYSSWPIIQFSIIGYLIALFLLLAFPDYNWTKKFGYTCFSIALILQLSSLIIRSWVLMRPPVSNMFETVIYVPFIGALTAIGLSRGMNSHWPVAASALLSAVLLSILEVADLNRGFENVQAVLNSNFWLTTHVLMIVGSYGILILAGVLSHFYLLCRSRCLKEQSLEKCIVQSLYLGIALLIPGTILGGVWAAQSWGRFWDWDPKESWAFISICTYLILIHLFRFNRISHLGLSFGAIIGLCVISFTWYGVNYILGTGMHTYGFGSGSHIYYLIFLLAESFFLIYMALKLRKNFLCKTPLGYIKD